MNNVDLVEKKDLFKVAEEFQNILGYEKRYFMILGLEGSGVKDFSQCLMDQAVKKPWEVDPFTMNEEVMKNISLEVVREGYKPDIGGTIWYEALSSGLE
ncbi:unnamed protein product, partial [Brassica rapa subsp. trilocularis]